MTMEENLFQMVKGYESDTFSASGVDLTVNEAQHITTYLINRAIQDMLDTRTLDGHDIMEGLNNIKRDDVKCYICTAMISREELDENCAYTLDNEPHCSEHYPSND